MVNKRIELILCSSSDMFSTVKFTPANTLPSSGVKKSSPSLSFISVAVNFKSVNIAVSLSPKVSLVFALVEDISFCSFVGASSGEQAAKENEKIKHKNKAINLTRSALAKIEVGQRHLYPDEILLIKEILSVSYEEIFEV